MASTVRRIVFSGIGVITPVGIGIDALWNGLVAGQSGIKPIQTFDVSSLSTRFAGEVPDFDAKNFIDKKERKSLRVMARGIQLAVAAAQLALDQGQVDKSKLDPTRFGVEFGAGLLATEISEIAPASKLSANGQPGAVDMKRWGEQGLAAIPPLWMLKYLPNMLACHVSILHNAQGPNNTITESDVAPLLALCETSRIIKRNLADFFLVGGAESKMNPLSFVRQCLFGRLSRRNEAPEQASRPFERQRDGLVIGEGAGVLVVEELEHAKKRGATILGELVGYGSAFDKDRTGQGIARAIRAALAQAGITADQLDHVNAHGLSALDVDVWEANGLRAAFGAQVPPVWALKSYFGNMGAGGGLSELAGSLWAMRQGTMPGTLNYAEADPACALPLTAAPRPVTKPYFLKLNLTELGQAAAVVCRRWDES